MYPHVQSLILFALYAMLIVTCIAISIEGIKVIFRAIGEFSQWFSLPDPNTQKHPRIESIEWIDVKQTLPKKNGRYLVFFARSDRYGFDTAEAEYDKSLPTKEEPSPWWFDGGLTWHGDVLFWSEMPSGPGLDRVKMLIRCEKSGVKPPPEVFPMIGRL